MYIQYNTERRNTLADKIYQQLSLPCEKTTNGKRAHQLIVWIGTDI
jgi:hypothetical protein